MLQGPRDAGSGLHGSGAGFFVVCRQLSEPVGKMAQDHIDFQISRIRSGCCAKNSFSPLSGISIVFRNDGGAAWPGFNHGHFTEILAGFHVRQFSLVRLAVVQIDPGRSFRNLEEALAEITFAKNNFLWNKDSFFHGRLFPFCTSLFFSACPAIFLLHLLFGNYMLFYVIVSRTGRLLERQTRREKQACCGVGNYC